MNPTQLTFITYYVLADYDEFNPGHDLGLLCLWLARMVGYLILRMVTSEWYSLLCFLGVILGMLALQSPEHHVKPIQRYFLALGREYWLISNFASQNLLSNHHVFLH